MGGLTGAVQWWEESQLRVLVLTSLLIQFLLFFFPILRRHALPGWFRFIMWLAYHGGDAVAIYGLAALFNRHKDHGDGGASNTLLEVAWAPLLLIHLGGHDGVTAYNIEDNELWTRHLLTAASQITVAVYAFCKSWPRGGDRRLLQAAILLFTIGVFKCFTKAMAFKRASIYSLVSSGATADHGNMCNRLNKYVENARDIVIRQQTKNHQDPGTVTTTSQPRLKKRARALVSSKDEAAEGSRKLFVDLSSSYSDRIGIFEIFWGLSEEAAYDTVQEGLASAFLLLYTKLKTSVTKDESTIILATQFSRMVLPWASIGLFHHSNREAYKGIDVKVTYAILCITALLEAYSTFVVATTFMENSSGDGWIWELWPQTVAQYSLVGYFLRNKKHNIKMRIVSLLGCKDFLDQLLCMEPCFSSARITHLVLRYLKDGWKNKIENAASYHSFNNHSSYWGLNMNRPFDECVLLWHLATDFCFFSSPSSPDHNCEFAKPITRGEMTEWMMGMKEICCGICTEFLRRNRPNTSSECKQDSLKCRAVLCRQVSNYMVYLLFVNPEMLLPGSRRNLFKTVYDELKGIDKLITDLVEKSKKKVSQEESSNEAMVTDTVITVTQENSEKSAQEGSSTKGSKRNENFIDQARDLAQNLSTMDDEMRMWEVILGVWVEMLCFSASRCRGYLHAKALGKGGEFLSHVWLLLFYMGMETFADKLQRVDLVNHESGNHAGTTPPLTSVDFKQRMMQARSWFDDHPDSE